MSNRGDLLNEAIGLIDGDRNSQYGDPIQDFRRTAAFWEEYLAGIVEARGGLELKPHDVAVMMDLLKISRIAWSYEKRDSWADLAGYAGCGWDCVVRQDDDPDGQ